MPAKHAVVLLSGGLDSATTLGAAIVEGYTIHALTFSYGQRHAKELIAAEQIAEFYNVNEHKLIDLDLKNITKSALLDEKSELPKNRPEGQIASEIPTTYVPARNLIMLSIALSFAESISAEAVFIGVNALDYSGYPDCRPEFMKAFETAAAMGTKTGVEGNAVSIKYPLINMTKAEIIKYGTGLKVPYHLTWSCYKGSEKACGKCDSCKLRLKGFTKAGLQDKLEYE